MSETFSIGIVCGKLGDVDGVSLETDKWINALVALGHRIYTFAGSYTNSLDSVDADKQCIIEDLRFDAPIQKRSEKIFFPYINSISHEYVPEKSIRNAIEDVQAMATKASSDIYQKIQQFDIDVLIGENTNALPMTLVGGMAVYQLAVQKRIATIFHHHDFWWERSRFSHSRIDDFLQEVMPPNDPGLEHVVISSYSQHVLSVIQRIKPRVVFNCEDFEHVTTRDDYNTQLRADIGLRSDDYFILQPTRIVPRKRIQDSIRFLGKLQELFPDLHGRLKFAVSLYQGDEPNDTYLYEIQKLSEQWDIEMMFIADRIAAVRGMVDGKRVYTNRDAMVQADLALYMPVWEGFGNALLEAMAARVPLVTTTYLVYKTDIKTVGFRNIEVRDQYDEEGNLVIPENALTYAHHILTHPEARAKMVEHNFQVGKREFDLPVLTKKLHSIISSYSDEIRASRRRQRKLGMNYSV